MTRVAGCVALLMMAPAAGGASRALPLGDAKRGQEVFQTRRCDTCHGIYGRGGDSAPDLGPPVGRGFAPYHLAGRLWNHAPAMWDAMLKRGMSIPQLSDQESADLFAYFFAAQFSEGRGNAAQGLSVFRSKRCGDCHGIGKPVKSGIQPVTAWPALRDPIALASDMWNHSEQMRSELDNARISQPRLSSGDLVNLMAYLHSLPEVRRAEVDFSPASAEGGQRLYAEKGCAGCHEGARALEARPTLFTLTDFAATMWNHAFRVPVKPVPLDYLEMRQIVGYMVSMQFFEERGEMEEGKRVYRNKGCGRCHDDAASAAPPRSAMAGRMTSFQIAAALWKHGPAMRLRMRQRGISWPRFNGSEMADLSAFLHGLEFKKRATGAARPGTPKK